jgi:hypothetical protein
MKNPQFLSSQVLPTVTTPVKNQISQFVSRMLAKRPLQISKLGLSIGTIAILLVPVPVFGITLVTNRAAIGETDRLDWSSLGAISPPAPTKTLPFNFSTTSQGGLGINVSIPAPAFTPPPPPITPPLLFQTTATGIPTNFASGDFILLTGLKPGTLPAVGNPGPLSITFDRPVSAVGTQIAVDDESTFTAFISAYDRSNNLLGNFSIAGTSSLALDNSAQFFGVSSDIANISKIVYSSDKSNRAFGINAVSIAQQVPEPFTTLGTIIGGIAAWKMKRKFKSIED